MNEIISLKMFIGESGLTNRVENYYTIWCKIIFIFQGLIGVAHKYSTTNYRVMPCNNHAQPLNYQ